MANSNRLLELDCLRGIAAISVVLYHYTTQYNNFYHHSDKLIIYFPYGKLGVNLFFIISGFVIFMTLQRVSDGLDFVVARFSRLYPAYWISGIITFIIVSTVGLPGREVGLKDALINLTMLELWLRVPYIDGVYWTLSVELSFYAIMLVLYKSNMLKRIEIIAIGWLSIILYARIVETYFMIHIPGVLQLTFLLNYGNLFIAGIMFYKIKTGRRSLINHIIIVFSLVIELICLRSNVEAIIMTGFLTIFYLFAYNKLSFIINRPLILLGAISYPLYLIHQYVGYVIIRSLYRFWLNPYIIVLMAMLASLFLAIVIHFSVEKWATRAIRSKYKKLIQDRNQRQQLLFQKD